MTEQEQQQRARVDDSWYLHCWITNLQRSLAQLRPGSLGHEDTEADIEVLTRVRSRLSQAEAALEKADELARALEALGPMMTPPELLDIFRTRDAYLAVRNEEAARVQSEPASTTEGSEG